MGNVYIEVAIIFLLVLANGIFAVAEFAIISARRARLQAEADTGSLMARTALHLLDEVGTFLATIQIGITLVGILAGIFGGATLAVRLDLLLESIDWLAPYSEALAVGTVVLLITFLSVILGELVPKRLALQNPEGFAKALALPMRFLSQAASPLVWLLSTSSNLVLRLLRLSRSEDRAVGMDEIKMMLLQGAETGVVKATEHEIVERVFRMDDMRITSLVTHRSDIVLLDLSKPETIRETLILEPRSVYPVVHGDLDNVVGMVRAEDVLSSSLGLEGRIDLTAIMRPPIFVPETLTALRVLELLKPTGMTMALVVDEFGTVQGLVTLKDFWDAVVGTNVVTSSPQDLSEQSFVQTPDGSWLVDGQVTVGEFKDVLSLDLAEAGGGHDFDTIGGFIMAQLGRIPATADTITWRNFEFQVVDMDGNRIDKVRVTAQEITEEEL